MPANNISRSIYLSRLRRAFLLRVHPDRFRIRSDDVRKEQAALVQVLTDRLGESDFVAYVAQTQSRDCLKLLSTSKKTSHDSFSYSVESHDGQLIKSTINLNSSPQSILESMAESINFPAPPSKSSTQSTTGMSTNGMMRCELGNTTNTNTTNGDFNIREHVDQIIWNAGLFGRGQYSHQFRTGSSHDRTLLNFLKRMDQNQIKERKMNRLHASAAALVARRAFQFSAIDGTGLGWSSASLAICLSRLTALYDEHGSKLQTKSFYPFRLVLSSDESHEKVDDYEGIIRLNPAATPLQWLATLQSVTDDHVRSLKQNRQYLEKNLKVVEKFLGIRVVKGFSSDSSDYHSFIERLANDDLLDRSQNDHKSKSLTTPIYSCLVIESEQVARRCKLRRDGSIEAGTGMDIVEILKALLIFASPSNECHRNESRHKLEFNSVQERVVYEFGLLSSVNKVDVLVTYEQMTRCLIRILGKADGEKEILRSSMAGKSLGITGRGQPCHLGDDGSIIIPWNST